MAKLITTRHGKKQSHKTEMLGELTQVSGNGGSSTGPLSSDRFELVFERTETIGKDAGARYRARLWLDFDEAVAVLARAFRHGGTIDDVIEAARIRANLPATSIARRA